MRIHWLIAAPRWRAIKRRTRCSLRAEEAYSRAGVNPLIDRHKRTAYKCIANWGRTACAVKMVDGHDEVVGVVSGLVDEVSDAYNNAAARASFQSNLLNIALQLFLTIAFFFGASRVSLRARDLSQNVARNPRLAHLIAASIKTAMLIAAFYALGAALLQTGMFGVRGACLGRHAHLGGLYHCGHLYLGSSGHRIGIGVPIASDIEEARSAALCFGGVDLCN